ncbi:unnamed protein product [Closterium sp. Naga37s-1]|nr:unnamed protein product [Closterium sp. Naga37s-1]
MAVTADRVREEGEDAGKSGDGGGGAAGGRTCLVQGYLLKRSETLHLWNQRWFVLDPTTARMEYRMQRSDVYPRGHIVFDADSTITVSPLNFHGAKQYDGCCFYVGTAGKKEYFLCAETPEAARAWVVTIRAAAQVLRAHRAAVSLLGSASGPAVSGAVAAATAAAEEAAGQAQRNVAVANERALQHGAATAFFSLGAPSPVQAAALTPTSIASAAAATTAAAAAGAGASGSAHAAMGNGRGGAGGVEGGAVAPSGDSVHLLKVIALHTAQMCAWEGACSCEDGTHAFHACVGPAAPETLRVKDEEIHALALALRHRDSAIADLTRRLDDAAAAADVAAAAAAQAARERDEVRAAACKLCDDLEARFERSEQQQAGSKAGRVAAEQEAERARAQVAQLQVALVEAKARADREEAGRRAAEGEMLHWKAEAERFVTAGLASLTPSCPSTTASAIAAGTAAGREPLSSSTPSTSTSLPAPPFHPTTLPPADPPLTSPIPMPSLSPSPSFLTPVPHTASACAVPAVDPHPAPLTALHTPPTVTAVLPAAAAAAAAAGGGGGGALSNAPVTGDGNSDGNTATLAAAPVGEASAADAAAKAFTHMSTTDAALSVASTKY